MEASRETQAIHRSHTQYFLRLAETAAPELFGPQQIEWLERLEAEHDNFRAALRRALEQREVELAARLSVARKRIVSRLCGPPRGAMPGARVGGAFCEWLFV